MVNVQLKSLIVEEKNLFVLHIWYLVLTTHEARRSATDLAIREHSGLSMLKEFKFILNHSHDFEIKWPTFSLQCGHNGRDGVSNHQPHECLLNRLFGYWSMKTSKIRVTGLCAGNSPVTGEFPAQMVSDAENISIWWRHHVYKWNGNYMTAEHFVIFIV